MLLAHQKAKHFRCHVCNKRTFNVPGLVIHYREVRFIFSGGSAGPFSTHSSVGRQMHNETLSAVPNAVEGRDDPKLNIVGSEGVPGSESSKPAAAPLAAAQLPFGSGMGGGGGGGFAPPFLCVALGQARHGAAATHLASLRLLVFRGV